MENNDFTPTRYSDEELEEFRAIIMEKLEAARAEYNTWIIRLKPSVQFT